MVVVACGQAGTVDTSTTSTLPPPSTTTLAAVDVYGAISRSLAFVSTPVASGSAVLVDPETLVTNAHVVWPFATVDVSFPNGAGGRAPVTGYDWVADLAIVDVSALEDLPPPAPLADRRLSPGEVVYLVGYPSDDTSTASPAITAGIVSRLRQWEDAGLTFVQSDALISGGQSGGALADDRGQVIGISGLSIGEGFALALVTGDVLTRLPAMRAGVDGDGLGGRAFDDLAGLSSSEGATANGLDEAVFVFDGQQGDTVSVEVRGSQQLSVDLVGPDGYVEASAGEGGVRAALDADLVVSGPYFLVVYSEVGGIDAIDVSGVDARAWHDPDHGQTVSVGGSVVANGDYPGDLDWFSITLQAGQRIRIRATSINIDPAILVDAVDPIDEGAFASDSDSGGGVLGLDAELEYVAPGDGLYAIAVFDETGFGPGAYVLSIEAGSR